MILLAILAMIVFKQAKVSACKQTLAWAGMMVLAVLIHPYYIPMVGVLMLISVILTHKKWLTSAIKLLVPIVFALIVMWLIGAFTPTKNYVVAMDLQTYAMNLVSLIDPGPGDYSAFLSHARFANALTPNFESFEKTNYLGFGVILLLPVVFFSFLQSLSKKRPEQMKKKLLSLLTLRNILIGVVVVGCTLLALGTHIRLGSHVLFEWRLPSQIIDLWLIFRACARLFWPVYYLIIVGVLYCSIKQFKKAKWYFAALFLACFAFVQLVDVRLSTGVRNTIATVSRAARPQVLSPKSQKLIKRYCDRGHLEPLQAVGSDSFPELSVVAHKCNMTLSRGYYAHDFKFAELQARTDKQISELKAGIADPYTNLFITTDKALVDETSDKYVWDEVEHLYAAAKKKL
ncbi:MAG: hypothetical protein LBH36_02980 [Candidatus Nomurabacteria bacterium]|nr:hypothetical protein [Candidatus Nomurabacteria bacterium]